jgi:hypothetical protein
MEYGERWRSRAHRGGFPCMRCARTNARAGAPARAGLHLYLSQARAQTPDPCDRRVRTARRVSHNRERGTRGRSHEPLSDGARCSSPTPPPLPSPLPPVSQPVAAAAGLAAALRPAGAALASFAKDSGLGPELAKALPAAAGALPGGAGGFQSLTSQPSAAHAAADAAAAPVFSGEQSILATVPGGNGHSVFGRMGSAPGTPLTAPGSAAPGYAPEVYKPSSAAEPGGGPSAASGDRLASTELVPGAMAFPGSGVSERRECPVCAVFFFFFFPWGFFLFMCP